MRFFTMDWWHECQRGSKANPSEEYLRHLALLRPFPESVAALDHIPTLHDAHLRRVEYLDGARMELALDAWGARGGRSPLRLSYGGVEGFTMEADPEIALPGPYGLGDLGYDEIDTPSPGLFEHRLLFSSGVELCIRFREFTFHAEAVL